MIDKSNTKGFTLIELLVVLAIISLLSSIIFSLTREPRAKAGDAARIETLKSFELALELYYGTHGRYPTIAAPDDDTSSAGSSADFQNCFGQPWDAFINGVSCSQFDLDGDFGVIDFADLSFFGSAGHQTYCYTYRQIDVNSGECSVYAQIRYDDSALGSVSPGFVEILANPAERYISTEDWNDPLKPTLTSKMVYNCRYIVDALENSNNNVQKYVLHCRMENQNATSIGDQGINSVLYEIQKPNRWLCITDNLINEHERCEL